MSRWVARIAGLVGLALAAGLLVLLAACGEAGDGADAAAVRDPEVTGDPLPAFSPTAPDRALGLPAPEVRGTNFAGSSVAIVNDGRLKAVVFLAHWCPHCQREVPDVQQWVDAGGKPTSVDIYAVATAIDQTRSNYPPDAWLEREGWTSPVLVDTNDSVLRAYGLTGFPTWVFISADGTVALRVAGALGAAQLKVLFQGVG
ncbi:MAG: TlpA disulfide reductase family protein [Chloroflexota bacterium]|nr:TlpA disulfide reductase family protein [Chloroflexota bacterium]